MSPPAPRWRGRRSSGPDDEPVSMRDALGSVGSELGLPDPGALGALTERWPDIVGPAIAPHAHVRSVRGGVLTVAVDAPVWATELRYLEETLVERLEEVTGAGVVRSVRVVVDPPT